MPTQPSDGLVELVGVESNVNLVHLRHEALVEQEREGRFLRYRAGTAQLQVLLNFLYAECCTRQPVVNISVPAKA